jgi:hypothetical protein
LATKSTKSAKTIFGWDTTITFRFVLRRDQGVGSSTLRWNDLRFDVTVGPEKKRHGLLKRWLFASDPAEN